MISDLIPPTTVNVPATNVVPSNNPASITYENTPSAGISSLRPGKMGVARDPTADSYVPSISTLPGYPTGPVASPVSIVSGDPRNLQVPPSGISYSSNTYTKTTSQIAASTPPTRPQDLILPSKKKHGRGMRNQKRRLGRT
ncbi:hypothetical protein DFH28DRAFT_1182142, partial [Melampsora americana]